MPSAGVVALEQQADAVDREVVREAEDLAIAQQQAAPGDEHEARDAAAIAGARDDPVPRDVSSDSMPYGRTTRVRSSCSSPPMLQPIDGAVAHLAGEPARGLQDERALVGAGDERGQRLADVDGEGDERADAERHLLLGDDGVRGHTFNVGRR